MFIVEALWFMSGNNTRTTKKRIISLLFLTIGIVGWFIPSSNILNNQRLELPNSHPEGLYIDIGGNVFCGSRTYERIQMYDKQAKFVRAFDTDIGKGRGGLFTFKVENSQLHIHVFGTQSKPERIDRIIVYALDGNMILMKDIPSTEYASYTVKNEAYDTFGNYYVFKGLLYPRVIKKVNENSTVIIRTPFYFWLFQSPFPAFVFIFGSLLTLVGFKNILRPREGKLKKDKQRYQSHLD